MSLARPVRRDVVIAGAVALAFAIECAVNPSARGPYAVDLAFYGAAAACLVWRRAYPLASGILVMLFALGGSSLGSGVTHIASPLLFLVLVPFAVGHETEGRRGYLGLALLVGLMVGITTIDTGRLRTSDFGFPAGIQIAAWACARLLRNRMLLTRTLADEAASIELDREKRAQAAVGQERARIAREMHDVVAHTMAIMVVQAGAARSVLDRDPAAAEAALRTVEDTGRVALGELRRMLGFLRDDGPAELAPQPSLDALDDLVGRAREAGLPVELRAEGAPLDLDAGAQLAAYRVVQESLTNTIKHAGAGARAAVTMRWERGGLELTVVDAGGEGGPGGGSGQGLIGMRERVAMIGGELEAHPRPEGGFAVRAFIPHSEVPVA